MGFELSRVRCISVSTQCGKPVVQPYGGRIVGGHEAQMGSWPWMVSATLDKQKIKETHLILIITERANTDTHARLW